MSDYFLGEIRWMAFPFAPNGWQPCNGQVLPISQYQALFSLLGTSYGGDGITTFALPDLRGRVSVGVGSGPVGYYVQGQTGGEEGHTLLTTEMPLHLHSLNAYSGAADSGSTPTPAGPSVSLAQAYAVPAGGGTVPVNRYSTASASGTMAPGEIGSVGGNQPHENRQPFEVMTFCIATTGLFPSRN